MNNTNEIIMDSSNTSGNPEIDNTTTTSITTDSPETKIKNNIKDLINKINISFIDEGNEYSIKEGNIFSKITNTNNQKSTSNGTTIDLLDCEYKLKSIYNISNLSSLYLQIYEIKTYNAKRCIREALGQLLEYNHYPSRQSSDILYGELLGIVK